LEVTYCSTYGDLCRCTLYALTHRRSLWVRFAVPIAYGTWTLGHQLRYLGWLGFPVAALVMTVVLAAFIAFFMQILIAWRVLTPKSRRRYTTTLTPEGFVDSTPLKTKSVPWPAVSEVRREWGDVYFWQKGKDSVFVPRSAFKNPQQSQEFYQCALDFWNAAKEGRTPVLFQDGSVWPPAPRWGA